MPSPSSVAEIESTLLAELAEILAVSPSEITAETPIQTLGLDSLRLFELFVLVEKQFGVSLLDGPITKATLENVGSLSRHIAAQLGDGKL